MPNGDLGYPEPELWEQVKTLQHNYLQAQAKLQGALAERNQLRAAVAKLKERLADKVMNDD